MSDDRVVTAFRGGGILFFGRLFEYASRFVFGIIVARALGVEGFGLYYLGVTTAAVLSGFATLGLQAGMQRFVPPALQRGDEAKVWGTLQVGLTVPVVAGLGLAAILLGLAEFLAENLFHEAGLVAFLRWVGFIIPVTVVGRMLMAVTRSFKRMQYQLYAYSIVFSLSKIALTVLMLRLGLGVPGVLAAHAIAWLLTDMLLLYFVDRLFSLRRPLREARRNVRELLSFSLPLAPSSVIQQLRGQLQLLLLGMLGSLAAVGVYSAAVRVQMVGSMLLVAASQGARPIISELYDRGETAQLERLYQTLTRWSLSFVLPYFLTVIFFAGPILGIFGEDFEVGVAALVVISLGTLVSAATGLCSSVIVMTGHSRLALLNSVTITVLSVTLNLILIPTWGLIGAAVATTLSVALVGVMRLFQVYRLLDLWPYNRQFVKPLAASAVILCIGAIGSEVAPTTSSSILWLVGVTALWVTYGAMVALLGLPAEDRLILSRTKRRLSAALSWH